METTAGPAHALRRSPGAVVVLLAAAASVSWLTFDRFPFGGDPSQYATGAITLFDTLRHAPSRWPSAMARTLGGLKAPGLPWIGQAFVPLGMVLGSIDRGLLLFVALTQVFTLGLTCSSLRRLSGSASAVLIGGLLVLSAPVQVMVSHQFFVEPLQTLATAYFVWIMACAPDWPRGPILAHLLLAASLGLLAKASTPLYCFGPGALALVHALGPSRLRGPWACPRPSTTIPLAMAIPLAVPTAIWYVVHFRSMWVHMQGASSGPIALYWGTRDTFANTLVYWLGALGEALFAAPGIAPLAAAGLAAGTLAWLRRRRSVRRTHFETCAVVAAVQLAAILGTFSLADSRAPRFLAAAVPYCALLLAWSVVRLHAAARCIAILAVAAQFAIVHAAAFGWIRSARLERAFRTVDHTGRAAGVLEGIVSSTCYDPDDRPYTVVIGIDPGLLGDWLAPAPAEYVRARRRLADPPGPRCAYDYLGGNFFGGTAAEAWRHMLAEPARYLVMADPAVYPPRPMVFNRALAPGELPALMRYVTESGMFAPPVALAADAGILIFRRTDVPATGGPS